LDKDPPPRGENLFETTFVKKKYKTKKIQGKGGGRSPKMQTTSTGHDFKHSRGKKKTNSANARVTR